MLEQLERSQGTVKSDDIGHCPQWKPRWLVDVGQGCSVGITTDDGCFVVLCQDWYGNWRLSKHIPPTVAQFLGGLAVAGRIPSLD